MQNAAFDWDKNSVARLLELREKGLSAGEIAADFCQHYRHYVTRNAIIGKLGRLRVKPPPANGHGSIGNHNSVGPHEYPTRRLPPNLPPAQASELPVEFSKHAKTIWNLRPNSCRWPIAGAGEHMRYCGTRCSPPYCDRHRELAYKPPPKKF